MRPVRAQAPCVVDRDDCIEPAEIGLRFNRSEGLFAESWNDKTELTKPSNLIDFLQLILIVHYVLMVMVMIVNLKNG